MLAPSFVSHFDPPDLERMQERHHGANSGDVCRTRASFLTASIGEIVSSTKAVRMAAKSGMSRRKVPQPFKSLALVLSGLILALPLLGLDCEMTCARSASRVDTKKQIPSAEHCADHSESAPARSTNSPGTPDGCRHHTDSVAVKKAFQGAERGCKVSALDAFPSVFLEDTLDRNPALFSSPTAGAAPRPSAALPLVLRL